MRLCLRNALVIHGDPAVPPRRGDVVVEPPVIAAVLPPGAPVGEAREIDLGGRALLPGLIDCHVHLCLTGDVHTTATYAADTPAWRTLRAVAHAGQHLAAGVTTVRDLGGPDDVVFAVRDAIAQGLVSGPRVVAAGRPVTRSDGHGNWMGVAADDRAALVRAVEGRVAAGAGCVKLMASGGVHTPGSELMRSQYDLATLTAGVEAAHAAGLRVASHASAPEAIAWSARAGVDSVEHGVFLDDSTAALLAERGTVLVPTLAATHLFAPHAGDPEIPEYVRAKARLTVPAHRESFPRARRHGVRIAVGTDAGSSFVGHGRAALEAALLCRYGVLPAEALAAATLWAAALLGLGGRVGAVEVGKLADLIVVDGAPLADVTALERVVLVVKDGALVHDRLGPTPRPPGRPDPRGRRGRPCARPA